MRKPWWQTSKANTALFSFVAATVLITAISIGLYSASRSTGKTGTTLSNTTPSGKTLTNLGPVYIPERLVIPKIAVDADI
ncbi:MAG: hypothetical protein Q7R65_04835, partial [bacterium]|nr:hypothetical protein [bacterium]